MNNEYKIVSIDDLTPYANNSRTHSDDQISEVARSISEFGFTNPILIDEAGGIIAGHGRLLAAKQVGMDEVPTITLHGLTPDQAKAYVIADNQLAMLKVEIEALQELDFDIDILGFDGSFLANLYMDGSEINNESPDDFKEVGEEELDHICPKCGFEFDE